MPANNRFRHQIYQSSEPAGAYEILSPSRPPPLDSDEFREQLSTAGQIYRSAGVQAIYLLHGTFVGADAFGLVRKLRRIWRSAGERIELNMKELLDAVLLDAGNYTPDYAQRLETGLTPAGELPIPVRLCLWSGENHHIGRADGAVRLINALLNHAPGSRILVFSHSHGGNVMALITNLLAADDALCGTFFDACRSYYRWPWADGIHFTTWKNVLEAFRDQSAHERLRSLKLDIVTLGTPIRYGWDSGGYDHLLHFVNHRPRPDQCPFVTALPRRFDDVLHATDGDYIQQFGIAGTGLSPTWISWRTGRANRKLRALLQQNLENRRFVLRFPSNTRVASDGLTLLVDYGDAGSSFVTNLAGHAVYTRQQWMAYHALEVARRFYGA